MKIREVDMEEGERRERERERERFFSIADIVFSRQIVRHPYRSGLLSPANIASFPFNTFRGSTRHALSFFGP